MVGVALLTLRFPVTILFPPRTHTCTVSPSNGALVLFTFPFTHSTPTHRKHTHADPERTGAVGLTSTHWTSPSFRFLISYLPRANAPSSPLMAMPSMLPIAPNLQVDWKG